MKKVGFFLGFGLLPFWVATIVTFIGSLQPSRPSEYWAVAPWLVIASIPFCGATLLIAVATLVRQTSASGDRVQKFKAARSLFGSLVFLACVIVGVWWLRHESRQSDFKLEEVRAVEFVENQGVVLLKGGGGTLPADVQVMTTNDGIPLRYQIGITSGYAFVKVNRSSSGNEFQLECFTSFNNVSIFDPCK